MRMPSPIHYEPGSYRDRDARVFFDDAGRVCRALSDHALNEWNALQQTRFFRQAIDHGNVVRTEQAERSEHGLIDPSTPWSGLLKHETIPFVSYPFEWSFGMLQDAALLYLDLLTAALDESFTLKDGTAYNVQWVGTRPVLIDVVSFERLAAGQAWTGYRQFCQTFLYPLLLQAYKHIPFQPWLRGCLDGISPQDCWSLMSYRDFFRRGVPSHVFLHKWLQSRRELDERDSKQALSTAGFNTEVIRHNVRGLQRLVRGLRWTPPESTWSDYAETNRYSSDDRDRKECFVRSVVQSRRWKLVWDVGCNTGQFARIAAENSEQVVAIDADPPTIERLYQSLKSQSDARHTPILPLVNDLVDLPGGLGWRGRERQALFDRGKPELTLCLALVHHLVIGRGVPLRDLLDWFAELGTSLVIEFVAKEDPQVQRLLHGRRDNDSDYDPLVFERLLSERFEVIRSESLGSGTRRLYFAQARSTS